MSRADEMVDLFDLFTHKPRKNDKMFQLPSLKWQASCGSFQDKVCYLREVSKTKVVIDVAVSLKQSSFIEKKRFWVEWIILNIKKGV